MTQSELPSRYVAPILVGGGGSGRVYHVHDSLRDRDLALKLVTPAESAFLRREFNTLRQIRHENLIQVFDWGSLPAGEAYYTMELIEGQDWGGAMGRPQGEAEVRRILTGLLRGLAHLHSHGEIHGDLKPANILLSRGGLVKVSDVGMGGSGGRAEGPAGTPGYAAPEIWEGKSANERSDLYSVGVMAYEAVTGRHPFEGKTIREVVAGQMEGWVPSPGAHGLRVALDLERAVMRALERDPNLRPATADEFMEGLGVEDRIGVIHGGRFANRAAALARLRATMEAVAAGSPNLIFITGPPGVGKSAVCQEFADSVHSIGGRTFQLDWERGLESVLHIHELQGRRDRPAHGRDQINSTTAAEHVWRVSRRTPIVLSFDLRSGTPSNDGAWIRDLARYLWAMSRESNVRTQFLIMITCQSAPETRYEFELEIQLQPLERADCDAVVSGVLGRASLPDELYAWFHTTTGGNPAAIVAAIEELIQRGSLTRGGGAWKFRETESIRALDVRTLDTPWATHWPSLKPAEQLALQALALVPEGLPTSSILLLTEQKCDGVVLRALEARGWIRIQFESWRPASSSVATFVRAHTPHDSAQWLARELLAKLQGSLNRETRATLLLAAANDGVALEEGVWAADQAMALGQYARAVALLSQCSEVASLLNDDSSLVEVSLKLGEALHQQGKDIDALELLDRKIPELALGPRAASAYRLLGEVNTAVGDLSSARVALQQSIALAELHGDKSSFFGAHSALAEIDWRHGDEATRNQAVVRMESVVASLQGTQDESPELASLVYQLGAALIVLGKRERALELLVPVHATTTSAYWKMRIANALATATYYLGRFDEALEWLDRAWSIAEQSGFDGFKARIHSNRAGLLYGRGRFSEAVDSHRTSSKWARRTGNLFEFEAAALGAAVNLIYLAEYEKAIGQAELGMRAARSLENQHEIAKSVEMEALARYLIGDLAAARGLIEELGREVPDLGGEQVQPRLNWLLGRIMADTGDFARAEALLHEAESVLRDTKDWEDLPGVQIELAHVKSKRGDADFRLDSVAAILLASEVARAPVVQLQGALMISDCIRRRDVAGNGFDEIVLDGLRLAERSGAREYAWRLNFNLGEGAARVGDTRTAQSRFAAALRIFREVADELQPSNRRLYLGTSHGALLIERVAAFRAA